MKAPGKWANFMVFYLKTYYAGHTGVVGLTEGRMLKAHPELQAMLIDVLQYKPT